MSTISEIIVDIFYIIIYNTYVTYLGGFTYEKNFLGGIL
jgi:hypothetical protein